VHLATTGDSETCYDIGWVVNEICGIQTTYTCIYDILHAKYQIGLVYASQDGRTPGSLRAAPFSTVAWICESVGTASGRAVDP
jgi:hypothetical protein